MERNTKGIITFCGITTLPVLLMFAPGLMGNYPLTTIGAGLVAIAALWVPSGEATNEKQVERARAVEVLVNDREALKDRSRPVTPVEPMLFGDILTVEQLYEVYHSMLRIRTRREDAL